MVQKDGKIGASFAMALTPKTNGVLKAEGWYKDQVLSYVGLDVPDTVDVQGESENEDNNRVNVLFEATDKSVVKINLGSFLNQNVQSGDDVVKMYKALSDNESKGFIDLDSEYTVVGVENSQINGKNIYPVMAYRKFQDKVKELSLEKDYTRNTIWQDEYKEDINSFKTGDVADLSDPNTEPYKTLTLKF